MAFSVKHTTTFRYHPPVGESVMEVRMQPRSDLRQRCMTFSLDVNPHANVMMYHDFFGNAVHHFDIPGRHSHIEVMAQAIVDINQSLRPAPVECTWDELDARVGEGDYWEMLLPSQYAKATPLLAELAAELDLQRRDSPLQLVAALNESLYRKFDYAPNSTKVDSPIDDALRSRRGVCQDFAHIMIALVRQLKIPCRYVSGYLFHENKTKDRSPAGATHAWVEAYLGPAGWVAFDPTNNLAETERHILVAVGRDYADVPPTRGVYKGEAESELSVRVVVAPVDAPDPGELPPAMILRTRRPDSKPNGAPDQQQQQQQ
jgi:transglutaminase-like putative cysteine protease